MQVFYHHFLTSSIAVLFLASTHAPMFFSAQCREEFHMALELVKDLSSKSWVSQRLWRTVKSLKAYAPKLGLQAEEEPRQRENAALTMAGMATSGHGQQHMMSAASTHRSSVSSAGHQPTPSPGLTPGYGSHHQHSSGRMGSNTPLAGRNSPRAMGNGHMPSPLPTQPQQPTTQAEDPNNGLRLTTEMSRMFEDFTSSAAQANQYQGGPEQFFAGSMSDYSPAGLGPHMQEVDREGMIQLPDGTFKELF